MRSGDKGLVRGPAYQVFDALGNLVRTQFVLNADFTVDSSCIGTNLDGVVGDEVIVGGREVTGLARGPAFQGFGSNGIIQAHPVCVESGFYGDEVYGSQCRCEQRALSYPAERRQDLGGGRRINCLMQLETLYLTRFVLNPDFTEVQVFGANTTNSVAAEEIVTGGIETGGLARGPAVQIWDKNGNHLFTRLVLNPDFTEVTFTQDRHQQ